MSSILRGGRLSSTNKEMVRFISSLRDDKRIAHACVLINEAHVVALREANAISKTDAGKLLRALRPLEHRIPMRDGVEDVHVLIEEYVTRHAGREVGGQLHLAKSRNDQVATAIRMTLRGELLRVSNQLLSLERVILQLARKHLRSVFPGFTHLQPAQPISFAHYLLAIGDAMLRDNQRVLEVYKRVNMSPLGSGALAGSSFNLDRALEAKLLGFDGIIENTLDAVGSRDFALEALSALSITSADLSRIAQDLIFYSSTGLIAIPDEYTSTSSIMPQKKNPDPLEIMRAESARVASNYITSLTIMHGLPSGYNLDFQEITPLLWDSCDTLRSCLKMLSRIIPRLKHDLAIAQRESLQYIAATEIANILVREEKVPFRSAHRAVGRSVRIALGRKKKLRELTIAEWELGLQRRLSKKTLHSIMKVLNLAQHIEYYRTKGSPNPKQTALMIRSRTKRVRLLLEENTQAKSKLNRDLTKLSSVGRQFAS